MYCIYQLMSPISDPGTLIMLRSPYPWRVEEPSIYESVRVHTAIQTGRTENDLVPIAPSVRPFLKPQYVLNDPVLHKKHKSFPS